VKCPDDIEGCGVGALGSAVVGVHTPPGLEMCDRTFDHVANIVDRGIELFLLFDKLPAGRLAERGGDASAEVAFVADGVIMAEEFSQASGVDGLRIVGVSGPPGVSGKQVGDMHQVRSLNYY
jgi:hypothetical protein